MARPAPPFSRQVAASASLTPQQKGGRPTASIRYFQTSFSGVAQKVVNLIDGNFTTQKRSYSGDKFSWIEQKMAVRLQTKTQTSSWTSVFPTETIQSQAQSLAFMKKFTVIL